MTGLHVIFHHDMIISVLLNSATRADFVIFIKYGSIMPNHWNVTSFFESVRGDLIKIRLVKYWLKSAPLPYCIAYRKSLFFIVWLVGEGGGRGLPRIFPFHFYMFLKKWGQPPMQRACIRYQVHVLFIICITSCVNVKTRIFIL